MTVDGFCFAFFGYCYIIETFVFGFVSFFVFELFLVYLVFSYTVVIFQ